MPSSESHSPSHSHVGKEQGHVGKEQGHVGKEQGHSGKEQSHVGKEQGHSGDVQGPDPTKLSEMRAAVALRLQRVCSGMDEQQFSALVSRISEFKIKWGESLIYDNPPALGGWMFDRQKEDPPR